MTLLHAQKPRSIGAEELFKLGIENSLKLKSDRINVAIANDEETLSKNSRLPTISLNLAGGYLGKFTVYKHGLTDPSYPYMPNWDQNYNISLEQPIYEGGKIKKGIEKATIQNELIELSLHKDRADLKLALMGKYLELFRWYKQHEVVSRNIEEAEQRLHDMQSMKKQGMITGNDLIRSELQLNNLNLMLREVKDNIQITSQQLDIALGLNENLVLKPDEKLLEQTPPIEPIDSYVQQAYLQFPELQIVNSEIKLARKQEEIVKAGYLPSLSLHAGNELVRPIINTSPVLDMFYNSWNVTMKFSYNLSSLYQNPKKVNIARQAISYQMVQKEQQEQNIRLNIKSAFIKHQEALDKVDVLTQSVKQTEENYRIVYNRYKNNLAILTDLLDASGVKLDAEMQLTTAKTSALYTHYQLLRMSGTL